MTVDSQSTGQMSASKQTQNGRRKFAQRRMHERVQHAVFLVQAMTVFITLASRHGPGHDMQATYE